LKDLDLSKLKKYKAKLKYNFMENIPELSPEIHWDSIKRIDSSDTNVAKFVFTKGDAVAEAVLYKYPTYEDRTVICCSTQSGCPVGCRFCGAGDYFVRSLTTDEIISQPDYLLKQTGINPNKIKKLQIMFMSMGEPMLNYDALRLACINLYMNYPIARLLISTSAPRNFNAFKDLRRFSCIIPTIGLQFSVHESNDVERKKLIPSPTMTLSEIANEGVEWFKCTGRRPFFNYCVHPGNNEMIDVLCLKNYFDPAIWESTISVICEREEHVAAANQRQRALAADFMQKMLKAGYSTRMFDPAGQDDIGGGCGQLWFVQDWMKNNPDKVKESKGYGLPEVHTPKL
jgi:23S rRNA (adenine2503-C2)-methyltransferase